MDRSLQAAVCVGCACKAGCARHLGAPRRPPAPASPLPGAGRRLALQRHVRAVAVHALVHAGIGALADAAAAGARGDRGVGSVGTVSARGPAAVKRGRARQQQTGCNTMPACLARCRITQRRQPRSARPSAPPHLTANSRPQSCSSTSPAEARPAALNPASAASSSSPLRLYTPGHCGGTRKGRVHSVRAKHHNLACPARLPSETSPHPPPPPPTPHTGLPCCWAVLPWLEGRAGLPSRILPRREDELRPGRGSKTGIR